MDYRERDFHSEVNKTLSFKIKLGFFRSFPVTPNKT